MHRARAAGARGSCRATCSCSHQPPPRVPLLPPPAAPAPRNSIYRTANALSLFTTPSHLSLRDTGSGHKLQVSGDERNTSPSCCQCQEKYRRDTASLPHLVSEAQTSKRAGVSQAAHPGKAGCVDSRAADSRAVISPHLSEQQRTGALMCSESTTR